MKNILSKFLSVGVIFVAYSFAANVMADLLIDAPFNATVSSSIPVDFAAIHADGTPATAASYEWNFGDPASKSNTANGKPTATHIYSKVGTYTVELITTKSGTTIKAKTYFDINIVALNALLIPRAKLVTGTITAKQDGSYDTTQTIPFVASNNNLRPNGTEHFVWHFGDTDTNTVGNSMMTKTGTASHQYKKAGTYMVSVSVQDNFDKQGTPPVVTSSLADVATMYVKITGTNVVDATPIAVIYKRDCGTECHGLDGRNGIYAPIAGMPTVIDKKKILASFSIPKMVNVPKLTDKQAGEMATYLATLPADPLLKGFLSYAAKCQQCHGTGSGGWGSDLVNDSKGNLRTVTAKHITDAIALDLKRKLANSSPRTDMAMIAFYKQLTPPAKELDNLVAYLVPHDKGGRDIFPLPKPTTGAALYSMFCGFCHGGTGAGGAYAKFSIRNQGVTAETIMSEINEDDKEDENMMFRLKGRVTENDAKLIAAFLATPIITK